MKLIVSSMLSAAIEAIQFDASFVTSMCASFLTRWVETLSNTQYKKLSYCWETVRRESMPRTAEMDVEMTT